MRFVPPLVVVAVLAVIGVRYALEPYRAEARELIAGRIQGGELERAADELSEYLKHYNTGDDRWFASRMWFRLRRPTEAIDAIWLDKAIAARPDTAHRFAEMALLTLGWSDAKREDATPLEPAALLTLTAGGNVWATEQLAERGRTLDLMQVVSYFFPAYRSSSRKPLDVLVHAFRTRTDEKFAVAAALGALRVEDYPEKAADIALLRGVIAGDMWRKPYRDVWAVGALALGRSGDAGATQALEKAAARLRASTNDRDAHDLPMIEIGLLAAGHFDGDEHLASIALRERPEINVLLWYLEALIHRYRLHDTRSELRLRQIWEGPGVMFPGLRTRIAQAFLLREEGPSAKAVKTFVDRMVADLERPEGPLEGHMLARAWRLRAGVPGARDAVLEALRVAARGFSAGGNAGGDLTAPFLEGLRALYLHG